MLDFDARQQDITAVDTATPLVDLAAATPGNFVVPGNAKYISEIRINANADWTADTALGFTSAINILPGGGIRAGGELSFGGPAGFTSGAAATSAGQCEGMPEIYQVYLPVNPGGEFQVNGFMLGEDCGSLRMGVEITYDGPLSPFPIRDADYRESAQTAVSTVTRLTDRNGATVNSLRPTTGHIGELRLQAGFKPTTGPIATETLFHLYGAALLYGGNFNAWGPSCCAQDDNTISGNARIYPSVIKKFGKTFPVKQGTNFDIEATMTEDDIGSLFPMCTVCYV